MIAKRKVARGGLGTRLYITAHEQSYNDESLEHSLKEPCGLCIVLRIVSLQPLVSVCGVSTGVWEVCMITNCTSHLADLRMSKMVIHTIGKSVHVQYMHIFLSI